MAKPKKTAAPKMAEPKNELADLERALYHAEMHGLLDRAKNLKDRIAQIKGGK